MIQLWSKWSQCRSRKKVCRGKDIWKRLVLSWEWKSEGVTKGESGESTEGEDVVGAGKGKSEIERQGWSWWREVGSWLQRQGEAYQKEQSAVGNKDDVIGWARAMRDEERVSLLLAYIRTEASSGNNYTQNAKVYGAVIIS